MPRVCEGTLGTWRSLGVPGHRAGRIRPLSKDEFRMQTTAARGICEPALEPPRRWAGGGRKSQGQNRTRENRPSGIIGGPREPWLMVELGTHLATERAGLVTLHLRASAPELYPNNEERGLRGRGGKGPAGRTMGIGRSGFGLLGLPHCAWPLRLLPLWFLFPCPHSLVIFGRCLRLASLRPGDGHCLLDSAGRECYT
jgi:hypothetical protein